MTKYMVTGSTGYFGGLALRYLAKKVPKSDIIALARSPEKAKKLSEDGFEVRIGDYTNYESLVNAFEGVDRLLFVSSLPSREVSRQIQHENVIDSAKEAGVKFIAYTSLIKADSNKLPLATDHLFTEEIIKSSGLDYAILRNGWYLENEANIIGTALQIGEFVHSAGTGRVSWALRREYVEAAVNVLVNDDIKQQIFELAGVPLTYDDLSTSLAGVVNQPLKASSLDSISHKRFLINNDFPEDFADYLVALHQGISKGMLESDSLDLQNILGRPLTPLSEAISEILKEI